MRDYHRFGVCSEGAPKAASIEIPDNEIRLYQIGRRFQVKLFPKSFIFGSDFPGSTYESSAGKIAHSHE